MSVSSRELKETLDFIKAYKGEEYGSVLTYTYERFSRYQELIIFEDVVDSVFKDVDDDVRHLTPSKSRLESLCGMVDSKMSHLLEKERQHSALEAAPVRDTSRTQIEEIIFHLLCDKFEEMFKNDQIILRMFSLWREDAGLKPRDFADILGIAISEIYDADARLKRRIRGIREEWLFKCSTKCLKQSKKR
ncbi:MAG: hypothetical protein LC803_09675 [Acidobacteria bacterium]|nr:hypothetical protein [Acidobacteriota bacterium]